MAPPPKVDNTFADDVVVTVGEVAMLRVAHVAAEGEARAVKVAPEADVECHVRVVLARESTHGRAAR